MSNTPYVPAGSKIFIQSAASTSQSITEITATNPPVVTLGTSAVADGDYVAITNVNGMTQFEDALLKAANVNASAKTFEAKNQDATGFPDFLSGSAQVITLGTELTCASGFSMSGGEQQFAEYQLLWDKMKRKVPTTQNSVSIDIPVIWDPFNAALIAVRKAADTGAKLGFKVVFPNGTEILFFGYIGASGLPSAQNANEVMTSSISITMASKPRYCN